MKKLLFLFLVIAPSTTFCGLKYDQKKYRFYSDKAPKNVNQDEYNGLVQQFINLYSADFLQGTIEEWVGMFAALRIIGTPAALQLMRDLEEMIKICKQDMQRLKNLMR
jgi:hypothetical protein